MKKLSFILLTLFTFCAFSTSLQAQEQELPTIDFENQTLKQYQAKAWPELISLGNQALKEGYDYYYLRLRIGIAYYEQKNYRLAEENFKMALQFNSNDEFTQEYLFYCYVFLNRTEEARKLSNTFSSELKSRLKLDKITAIDFIHAEAAIKKPKKIAYPNATNDYYDNAQYFQIGLKHSINNKFSLYHALSLYKQNSYFGAINQKQYFVQASLPIKNNWLLSPSFHFVRLDISNQITVNNETQLTNIKTNKNYNVKSLQISKAFKKFDFALGSTFSKVDNTSQNNHFIGVSYSFFGNSKLIFGCTNYLHTNDKYKSINNLFSPYIYIEPLQSVGINLGYFKNKKNNIIEGNGSLINNSFDLTSSRLSTLVNIRLNKVWNLYAIYQLENKIISTTNINYYNTLLLGGIKINTGL